MKRNVQTQSRIYQIVYATLKSKNVPIHVSMAHDSVVRGTAKALAQAIEAHTEVPQASPTNVALASEKYD